MARRQLIINNIYAPYEQKRHEKKYGAPTYIKKTFQVLRHTYCQ